MISRTSSFNKQSTKKSLEPHFQGSPSGNAKQFMDDWLSETQELTAPFLNSISPRSTHTTVPENPAVGHTDHYQPTMGIDPQALFSINSQHQHPSQLNSSTLPSTKFETTAQDASYIPDTDQPHSFQSPSELLTESSSKIYAPVAISGRSPQPLAHFLSDTSELPDTFKERFTNPPVQRHSPVHFTYGDTSFPSAAQNMPFYHEPIPSYGLVEHPQSPDIKNEFSASATQPFGGLRQTDTWTTDSSYPARQESSVWDNDGYIHPLSTTTTWSYAGESKAPVKYQGRMDSTDSYNPSEMDSSYSFAAQRPTHGFQSYGANAGNSRTYSMDIMGTANPNALPQPFGGPRQSYTFPGYGVADMNTGLSGSFSEQPLQSNWYGHSKASSPIYGYGKSSGSDLLLPADSRSNLGFSKLALDSEIGASGSAAMPVDLSPRGMHIGTLKGMLPNMEEGPLKQAVQTTINMLERHWDYSGGRINGELLAKIIHKEKAKIASDFREDFAPLYDQAAEYLLAKSKADFWQDAPSPKLEPHKAQSVYSADVDAEFEIDEPLEQPSAPIKRSNSEKPESEHGGSNLYGKKRQRKMEVAEQSKTPVRASTRERKSMNYAALPLDDPAFYPAALQNPQTETYAARAAKKAKPKYQAKPKKDGVLYQMHLRGERDPLASHERSALITQVSQDVYDYLKGNKKDYRRDAAEAKLRSQLAARINTDPELPRVPTPDMYRNYLHVLNSKSKRGFTNKHIKRDGTGRKK